jgi:hypothetical protein
MCCCRGGGEFLRIHRNFGHDRIRQKARDECRGNSAKMIASQSWSWNWGLCKNRQILECELSSLIDPGMKTIELMWISFTWIDGNNSQLVEWIPTGKRKSNFVQSTRACAIPPRRGKS